VFYNLYNRYGFVLNCDCSYGGFHFVSLVDELRCSLLVYIYMHIKCLFLCLNEIDCLVSAQTFFFFYNFITRVNNDQHLYLRTY
jgi:hypothetical protein